MKRLLCALWVCSMGAWACEGERADDQAFDEAPGSTGETESADDSESGDTGDTEGGPIESWVAPPPNPPAGGNSSGGDGTNTQPGT